MVNKAITDFPTMSASTLDEDLDWIPIIDANASSSTKNKKISRAGLLSTATQGNPYDNTVGKILLNGAFGLGGNGINITDFSTVASYSHFVAGGGSSVTTDDVPWGGNFKPGIVCYRSGSDRASILMFTNIGVAIRNYTAGVADGDWIELISNSGGQVIEGTLGSESFNAYTPTGDLAAEFRYAGSSGGARISATNGTNSNTFVDFDAPDISSSGGVVTYRLGRNTTEGTGETSVFHIYAHDGSSTIKTILNSEGDGEFSGKLSAGLFSPVYRLDVAETLNQIGARINSNNVSFTSVVQDLRCARTGSSSFEFMRMLSGGTSDTEFYFSGNGNAFADGSWSGGGADYAEYFEWSDEHLEWVKQWKEDKGTAAGISVVLDGDKIRPAQPGECPIGVISANPSVIGDVDGDKWKEKYLKDAFGAYIMEDYQVVSWTEEKVTEETEERQKTETVEVTEEKIFVVDGKAVKKTITSTKEEPVFEELDLYDEEGKLIGKHKVPVMETYTEESKTQVDHSYALDEVPSDVVVPEDAEYVTQQRRKLNPEYDPEREYVPRKDRVEWDTVGLMGKLRLYKGQPVCSRWIKMRDINEEVEEWLVR